MLTVYRYEDVDGTGPYQSLFSHLINLDHENDNYPNPEMEGFRGLKLQEYCALTREQFSKWFEPYECGHLEHHNFKLVEYSVPPDALPFKGNKQVVIIKDMCTKVRTLKHEDLICPSQNLDVEHS